MTSIPSLEEIQSLEEALHQPDTRRCRRTLEILLADGFMEIGASGRVYDRTTIMELLEREPGTGGNNLEIANYALKLISSDAVLLTYETKRSIPNGSVQCVLRSSIWKYDGCKWQMLFHQGTVKP